MLDTWNAGNYIRILPGGKTMPMQVGCFRRVKPGEAIAQKDFVVKTIGSPEITPGALFNECFGNILASHFGIMTAMPALINLHSGFVEQVKLTDDFQRNIATQVRDGGAAYDLQLGLAVGTEYLKGFGPVKKDIILNMPKDLEQAMRMFAFDMLVQNPDRTHTRKQNCAYYDNRLIAFDFELCFSFVYALSFLAAPAWKIDDTLARDHLFHPSLRGKRTDWTSFIDDLVDLSSDKIEQVFTTIPDAWNQHGDRIKRHLLEARDNALSFRKELERVTLL